MKHVARIALLLCPILLPLAADAAGNPRQGNVLAEKHCNACHVRMYGGDGSGIYTRQNRLIKNPTALLQRVAACNAQTNAGLFPEDEEHLAAYLNQQYYKFK